jgi:hypothetical protein
VESTGASSDIDPRWPDFFVVGASRSGTTSLWHYLNEHPDVYMSPVKEPMYFTEAGIAPDPSRADWMMHGETTRTVDEYLGLFAARTTEHAAGEASVAYLPSDFAAERIHAVLPHARIVAILRHPAERAFAEYAYSRAWGMETLPTFAEAVAAEQADVDHTGFRKFIEHGRYGAQLGRYFARFRREQIHVFLFDDLVADARMLVHDLYESLGVDPEFRAAVEKVHNEKRPIPRSRVATRAVDTLKRLPVKQLLPAQLRQGLRTGVAKLNQTVPEFPGEVRHELLAIFEQDITHLEQLIGRDLTAWRS